MSGTEFWLALLQIIYFDLILSGDNAVVIALACRSLPEKQRKMGVMFGAGAAVGLRILFASVITYLLLVPYLKIVGGVLLFWVGYKLMVQEEETEDVGTASNLFQAIRIIVVADAVMSLDNVLTVAAAAKGSILLLVIGLLISIPLVVYGATLLLKLIDRFPMVVPGGAALIGYIGGEILIGDPVWMAWIDANAAWLHFWAPLIGALGVVMVGRVIRPVSSLRSVGAEALGAAAVFTLGMIGRILITRAPLVILFVASLFGYTAADIPAIEHGLPGEAASVMDALRPIFAAVIAIVLGEIIAWWIRHRRGVPVHDTPGS